MTNMYKLCMAIFLSFYIILQKITHKIWPLYLNQNFRKFILNQDVYQISFCVYDFQATRHLFVAAEKRIPRIRIETRQADVLKGQKIIVSIDSWPRNSKYPVVSISCCRTCVHYIEGKHLRSSSAEVCPIFWRQSCHHFSFWLVQPTFFTN